MVNVRVLIAVILTVLAIHIIYLGLFSNSWTTREVEYEGKITTHIGLREEETIMDDALTDSYDLSDLVKYEDNDYIKGYNTAGLRAYIILWISLSVCIGAIVFTILGRLGKISGTIGIVLGFTGGGLILLASVLWVIMISDLESYMHLGWTFYVVIVGGIFQVVGSGLMIKTKKKESKRFNMKALVAVVLTVIVIHVIYLCIFTNSWATGEFEDGGTIRIGVGLREWECELPDTSSNTAELTLLAENEGGDKADFNSAGLTAYILQWIAVAVCIGAIFFTILGRSGKTSGKIGFILGFIGGGLILLAVLIWLIMVPELENNMSLGWIFYVAIVGGILQTISAILVYKANGEESKDL